MSSQQPTGYGHFHLRKRKSRNNYHFHFLMFSHMSTINSAGEQHERQSAVDSQSVSQRPDSQWTWSRWVTHMWGRDSGSCLSLLLHHYSSVCFHRLSSSYCSSCPGGRVRCTSATRSTSWETWRRGSCRTTTRSPRSRCGLRLPTHMPPARWNCTSISRVRRFKTGPCPPGD